MNGCKCKSQIYTSARKEFETPVKMGKMCYCVQELHLKTTILQ